MAESSLTEKTVKLEQKKEEDSEMIKKTSLEEVNFEFDKKSFLSEDQKSDLHQEVRTYSDTFLYIKDIQPISCRTFLV